MHVKDTLHTNIHVPVLLNILYWKVISRYLAQQIMLTDSQVDFMHIQILKPLNLFANGFQSPGAQIFSFSIKVLPCCPL